MRYTNRRILYFVSIETDVHVVAVQESCYFPQRQRSTRRAATDGDSGRGQYTDMHTDG